MGVLTFRYLYIIRRKPADPVFLPGNHPPSADFGILIIPAKRRLSPNLAQGHPREMGSDTTTLLIYASLGFGIVSLITAAIALKSAQFARRRWHSLLSGGDGARLEELLDLHAQDRGALEKRTRHLEARVTELEEKGRSAKRYLGLVRYDAFEDVGGSQSFALAVYDENGDGAILTSIVGRTDCRVYAKPLVKMQSERKLSQEEQRAISDARSDAPKTITSR